MPGWSIPDDGEGANTLQSALFQEYLDVLVEGLRGKNCVLSGCVVTTAGTSLTIDVAKGAVLSNGTMFAIAAGSVTIGTADATQPRFDLIVVNSAGTKAVRTGTAASSPKPAARSTDDVVLAVVYVPALAVLLASNKLVDLRALREQGPITIYKTVAAETTNTTAAAIHALNKAASGVTIPNGLFLSGKILRVKLGGNMLVNSGTPTVTVAISYGGTTMFSDVSAAGVASATRRGWFIDFYIAAQANNDQALTGQAQIQDTTTAPVAPTTGIGDIWGINTANQETQTAFAGSAAVDSDAADRVLAVTFTFSVSNAANELVVETATVELLG